MIIAMCFFGQTKIVKCFHKNLFSKFSSSACQIGIRVTNNDLDQAK
jgi:hypothetical protein